MAKNLSFYLITIIILIVSANSSKDGKCRVLALEGGGEKGAYQAGAIKGLIANTNATEHQWDVITGISVGALNAAGFSLFEPGDEDTAIDFILNMWKNIKGYTDIYQNWAMGGPLYGLMYETGLYDTAPLKLLLWKIIIGQSIKRKLIIGTTNIETGRIERYDFDKLMHDEYVDAILSSSAFPVIFPNIGFQNKTYIDGGVKIAVDIASGVHKCLDMGFNEADIIVDVVLCHSRFLAKRDPKSYHPMNVLIRFLEILSYDLAMKDVDEIIDVFEHVKFRYIVAPTKVLPSGLIPLDFTQSQIQEMIDMGVEDAKHVVAMGERESFKNYRKEYKKQRREVLFGDRK
jgi:predicted patatin/cPLA2 family phospholipase